MRRSDRLHDARRYEVLAAVYGREDRRVTAENVGAYRTKVEKAGEWLYISCYPLITAGARREQEAKLAELEQEISEGRSKIRRQWAKYNNARRTLEFEKLVHANFGRGDLHVCCTYEVVDYERSGEADYRSREDAKREIRNYIARVKRLLKRHECDLNEFRWIICTVTKEGMKEAYNPRPDTHHHHLLFHGVPEVLRGKVEDLWEFGTCNADRLQPSSDKGVAAMAGYIARQEGNANGERAGEKSYSCSRNIVRPEARVSDVKISRRRVAKIAADVRRDGREIFEQVWSEYRMAEAPVVKVSDFTAGAYIYARMRIKDGEGDRLKGGTKKYGKGTGKLV